VKKHDMKLGFMSIFVAGMCMCVSCVCVRVCMYALMCINVFVCMSVCMCVCVSRGHETGLHVYVRDWYTYVCVYICVRISISRRTFISLCLYLCV